MRGLVTGASRGLGLQVANQLSQTHKELLLIARNSDRLNAIKLPPAKVIPYAVDLSQDLTLFLNDVDFGQIDTFIHCAGVSMDNLLIKAKYQEIHSIFNVNLFSAMQLSQKVIRNMIKARRGNIIFFSSCVALKGNSGQSVYSASKAGIIGLTKSLAKELAPRGIRVNAISPGFFETDMTAQLSKDIKDDYRSKISLQRMGNPEEIKAAVKYLLDSSYVTGQVIEVDGGMQF